MSERAKADLDLLKSKRQIIIELDDSETGQILNKYDLSHAPLSEFAKQLVIDRISDVPDVAGIINLHDFLRFKVNQDYSSPSALFNKLGELHFCLPDLASQENYSWSIAQDKAYGQLSIGLINALLFSYLSTLRGRFSEVSVYGREAIECCAFIREILTNPSSAVRWCEAGDSSTKWGKYKSRFQLTQLVKKISFPGWDAEKTYDQLSRVLHPSVLSKKGRFSVQKAELFYEMTLSLYDDRTPQKRYDLAQNLVIAINLHFNVLHSLSLILKEKYPDLDYSEYDKEQMAYSQLYEQEKYRISELALPSEQEIL